MKRRLRRIACVTLICYAIFALLANTLPFVGEKTVSEEAALWLDQVEFTGEEKGVDQAGLIETPTEALGVRLALLREAERTVDITCHLFQSGGSTDAVLGELLHAADRGVQVRIMQDGTTGLLSVEMTRNLRALASHPNISYRRYNPIRLHRPWDWQVLLHDKFLAVDDRWLILGGRNLGDRYYAPQGYDGDLVDDRDVLVWRTGDLDDGDRSVLHELSAYMDLLWECEAAAEVTELRSTTDAECRLDALREVADDFERENPIFYEYDLAGYGAETVPTRQITLIYNPIHTGKKEPWVAYQMARLARGAQQSILIQTPYATANHSLLEIMDELAERLSDVAMVTNSAASTPNTLAFSNYYANRRKFAETGAQIWEYQSHDSIHGKSMVVDGHLSVVGSFNLDDRSFYLDTETMLVIDSEEFALLLTEAIGIIQAESLPVDEGGRGYPQDYALEPFEASLGKRAVLWIVSLFSRFFQYLI